MYVLSCTRRSQGISFPLELFHLVHYLQWYLSFSSAIQIGLCRNIKGHLSSVFVYSIPVPSSLDLLILEGLALAHRRSLPPRSRNSIQVCGFLSATVRPLSRRAFTRMPGHTFIGMLRTLTGPRISR